jgi:glycosyltransferase involved in cell wall biosynthesis
VQHFKISLITVTRNAQKTIGRCIESVIAQNYNNIEYIIIDGASTDDTLQIISQYKQHVDFFISEPDGGIYDAINKGLALATGDVIGALNADDYFADDNVIDAVAKVFADSATAALYGNLDYVRPSGTIVRKWRSKAYRPGLFNFGWMPPHPTFYCRKAVFDRLGGYNLGYGTAADYELMVRFIHLHQIRLRLLPKTMVKMGVGGVSNKNMANRIQAWRSDYKAMCDNGVAVPALAILLKPFRKILQYVSKRGNGLPEEIS